jgi:hypothetical protein
MTQNDKCGCKLNYPPNWREGYNAEITIVYCKTHSLAFEMREGLEKIKDNLVNKSGLNEHDYGNTVEIIEELLRKVKGTK